MSFDLFQSRLWQKMRKREEQLRDLPGWQRKGLIFAVPAAGLAISAALYGMSGVIHPLPAEKPHLMLNEVSLSEGWVELYNPTKEAISLEGWSFSNKKNELHRYAFPKNVSVGAGEYLLLSMENDPSANDLRTDFSLKRNGTLCLSREGSVVDSLSMPSALQKNASYGRLSKGEWTPMSPTPGADNAEAEVFPAVDTPVFSHGSGFYDEPFDVTIEAPEGTTIHYTLDGSEPTADSPEYTKPLTITDATENPNVYSMNSFLGALQKTPLEAQEKVYQDYYSNYLLPKEKVDKCTVLRAAAVDESGSVSETVTASYFVGFDGRTGYEDIPVLSLVSDPEGLYGMEKGILVTGKDYLDALEQGDVTTTTKWYAMRELFNYFQTGKEWERPVHIDYFNSDKSLSFTQEGGIKMHGNTSRRAAQKSFSLVADTGYDGNSQFLKPFFGNGLTTDKVLLTTALAPRRYLLTQRMNEGRTMYTQDYRLMQVFLDGEYCGFYAMQEAYDSGTYLEDHYGIDADDAVLMKGKGGKWLFEMGEEEDYDTYYQPLLDYVAQHDLSDPKAYEELCTMMDVDSFIDFYAAQIYICNLDWYEGQNGFLYYSKNRDASNPYADQRWHWLLYDLDYSSGTGESYAGYDSFNGPRLSKSRSLSNDPFFPALMKNEQFCQQFVNTFLDLGNGVYDSASINALLDDLAETYREAAWVCVGRYPKTDDGDTLNEETHDTRFKANCEEVKAFFDDRFAYTAEDMAEYFRLSGSFCTLTMVTKETERGSIRINSIHPDLSGGEWKGRYRTDYPVTVTAEPAEGYVFAGWKVSSKGLLTEQEETTAELKLYGDTMLEAVFEEE